MSSTMLAKAISNDTPALDIRIHRLDEHRAFASLTIAGKIEILSIRLKTKHGSTRVLWPTTPENKRDRNGQPQRLYPIVRILDEQLRAWLEGEILKALQETKPHLG